MPAYRKVWDLGAADGPKLLEMAALKAVEATTHDPERYKFEEPDKAATLAYQKKLADQRKLDRLPNPPPDQPLPTRDQQERDATTDIPEDWKDQPAAKRRELAISLGADDDANTAEADAFLAEAAKRGGK